MENDRIIERIKEDPKRAQYNQKVEVTWQGKYISDANIRKHNLKIDEPKSVSGDDMGPSPTELLLAAIGSCEMSMISREAFLRKIKIDQMNVDITGMIDIRGFLKIDDVPSGFQKITINLSIKSSESKEVIEELVKDVLEHCPVLGTIGTSPKLDISHNLNFQ